MMGRLFRGHPVGASRADAATVIPARGFPTGARSDLYPKALRSIPAEVWRRARRPGRRVIAAKLDTCTRDDLSIEITLARDLGRDAPTRLRAKLDSLHASPPDLVSIWQARLAVCLEIARIRADRLIVAECVKRLGAEPEPSRLAAWERCPLTGAAIGAPS